MAESSTKTAVVTAVLTGVFTVIAGVATYWLTTKEPELAYSVVGGPTLTGPAGTKRIFVVEVRNSGRKEVSQVLLQLSMPAGELSEVAFEASPGVKLTEERTQKETSSRADLLNPGDKLKASFLANLTISTTEPTVVVRAPGVQAKRQDAQQRGLFERERLPELLALGASALAAVLSSFLLFSRSLLGRKLGLPSIGPRLDQSEIGAFICAACGLHDVAHRFRFSASEVSFRGIADYLRCEARIAPADTRARYSTALRALALTDGYSKASLEVVRAAIDDVDASPITDAEFQKLRHDAIDEGSDPVKWRRVIESFVENRHGKG